MTTETETLVRPDAVLRPRPRRRVTGRSSGIRSITKHALLVLVSLIMVYPLIWLVVSSLKPNDQIFRDLSIFTTDLTFENYTNGWNDLQAPFGLFLLNSSIIALGAIVGNLLSCSMAAYAFARLQFRGRTLAFTVMLGSIMLPFQVLLVPQFLIYKELGWLNTFLPLIAPKFLATEAFFIFLMVQFIRGLPKELFEAARVDGAGHGQVFFRIILPLAAPAIASFAIFQFLWVWNDLLVATIFASPGALPITQALNSLSGTWGNKWFLQSAGTFISIIVPLIVFFALQRFFVRGLLAGATKG